MILSTKQRYIIQSHFQTRSKEDLRPKLIARIVQACEASGLTPAAYAEPGRQPGDG